ncbi:ELWxxDGT repeat protein [Pyxidicoccus sp. 3LG]
MRCWRPLPLVLVLLAGCSAPDSSTPAEGAADGTTSAQASQPWGPCTRKPIPLGPALMTADPEARIPLHGDNGLYFFAGTSDDGGALWMSSGSQGAGTLKVKDFAPGPTGMPPTQLTRVGDRIFFTAEDADHGRELWGSDGTAAGTKLVKDLWPGPTGSFPRSLFEHRGLLYFTAGDEDHGRELWKSDGTPDGTMMVADLDPGEEGTNPDRFVRAADGSLYFIAQLQSFFTGVMRMDDQGHVTELLRLSSEGAIVGNLTAVGSRVYFVKGDLHGHRLQLMVTQGGPPTVVVDLAVASDLVAMGGKLYFSGATDMGGMDTELWRSDGTAKGTRRVSDLRPGEKGSAPSGFAIVGRRLFFSADDGQHGRELWVSDGTEAGTRLFADLESGTGGSFPERLTEVQDNLFFSATTTGQGREPWTSNGTSVGTVPLREVALGTADSLPEHFVRSGWDVFFTAQDGTGVRRLWALPFRPDGRCDTAAR